ncbi:glycosyltransferase family 4 protein [Candidatus Pacearchaeota archaeon]|nr:glycosyltransferase family 4 protein [Candidatus Pacearchaeota archaeon]
MKIAVLGHSLIHARQQLFFDYMNSLEGVEILQIYPKGWGRQERDGGFQVAMGGSIKEFTFWDDAFQAIREFSPDIIYSQTEFWQAQSFRVRRWARTLEIPLIYFFWENIRMPDKTEIELIKDSEGVICGNAECQEIINKACPDVRTEIMPQVGIRTDIFKQMPKEKKLTDVLFVGRRTREKGIEYVDRLEQEPPSDRSDVWRLGNEKYENMPQVYNGANVLVVPSLTTDQWREQWPACIAESLACEVPVIAFDSGSIKSNYWGSSNVGIVPEGNYSMFKFAVEQTIARGSKHNKEGREWILEHMGHEAIAKKLLKVFEEI